MNTNETKVDVLGVLREFATKRDPFGSTDEAMRKYIETRNAVAELIEADREYDYTRAEMDRCPISITPLLWNRWVHALNRRAAALARIGGAA